MEVLFDPQIFSLQRFGGISRYISELAKSMFEMRLATVEICCPRYSSQYLKDVSSEVFDGREDVSNRSLWECRRMFDTMSNLHSFKQRLTQKRFDVVHHTYYWPLPNRLPVGARVTTIHDMIDEVVAPSFIKSRLKLQSIQQADHVICVSEFTRKNLLECYDIPSDKVSVVHLGKPLNVGRLAPLSVFGRPYILYVGPRSGYKNFHQMLHAYAVSVRVRQDFQLVCFGGGSFTPEEKRLFSENGLADTDVIHLAGDDAFLRAAYLGAALFVYPSLYEGFGLPPLEAMTLGVPVACSNVTSIPEVVGNAGEYFNPTELDSMLSAMESVLYSETRKQELIKAGHERSAGFSWEKCATETIGIYRAII